MGLPSGYQDLSILRERVRAAALDRKPVMGASDDTDAGWEAAIMQARQYVLRDVCLTLNCAGQDYLPTEVVMVILEARP